MNPVIIRKQDVSSSACALRPSRAESEVVNSVNSILLQTRFLFEKGGRQAVRF